MHAVNESKYPTPIPESASDRTRHRRTWPLVLLGLVLGLVVTLGGTALATGFGGHRHRAHGDVDEGEVRDHLDYVVGFVLSEVDASDAQREAIGELVTRVTPQLIALRDEGRALRDDLHEVLSTEPVDAAAVEALRLELVDLVDRASQIGLGALLEAGDVLTAEQRASIRERLERWRD